jgi:hypothetical protein
MNTTAMLFCVLLSALLFAPGFADQTASTTAQDNADLKKLYEQDQADRRPSGGTSIDWASVVSRDREREAHVQNLFTRDMLHTGHDYYHAALILMHSNAPESHLLAHELSIVAAIKGVDKARWLIAASEDRFLMNIGRPQRFGTQYRSPGPEEPMRLYDLDGVVTDRLRSELSVPSLEEAREREKAMK